MFHNNFAKLFTVFISAFCLVLCISSLSISEDKEVEMMTPQEVQNYVRQIGGGEIMVVTPAAKVVSTPCVAEVVNGENRTLLSPSPCADDEKKCDLKWVKKGVATCEMKGEPPCKTGDCSLCKCSKEIPIIGKKTKTFCACIPGGDCSKANDLIGDLIGFTCEKLNFPTPTPTYTPSPTPTPKPPTY